MKENDPLEWVKKADGDLDMAGRALRGKIIHTDSACYHAQQSAEKYFKAILVAKSIAFPKSHDLIILNSLCITNGILTAFSEDELDFISAFSIGVRYPGDDPTLEDAKRAIVFAKQIRKFTYKLLELE